MKRVFDVAASIVLLILLSPVFLIVALLLCITGPRPIIFTQSRVGKNNKLFNIYKFRSMKDVYDEKGNMLSDSVRLTPVGKIIRALSIDELPSLFCVLAGNMSIVGPRPLLPEYLPFYTPSQNRRHEVMPGVTGWAQVNGRNALSWEEKFEADVWYVDNQSFWLDLRIILLTVKVIVFRSGINNAGHATMPKFEGSAGINKENLPGD